MAGYCQIKGCKFAGVMQGFCEDHFMDHHEQLEQQLAAANGTNEQLAEAVAELTERLRRVRELWMSIKEATYSSEYGYDGEINQKMDALLEEK